MRQLKISRQVTNRETPSLDAYLHEISKLGMLSVEEEVEMAKRIKEGDEEALTKLVNSNLRFVVSVAKQYQNQGLSLPDLINEGNFGLMRAAKRFDETRGFKFISYAVWWIRQSILQALAEQSRIVRFPLNKVGIQNKVIKAFIRLEQDLEREPSADEVANYLKMRVDDVKAFMKTSTKHISMDAPINNEEEGTMYDLLSSEADELPDNMLITNSMRIEINRILSTLSPRESDIIRMYYGLSGNHPYSLDEIGEEFELTRERVRQIKEKALRRLKHTSKNRLLKSYLG
jgi:RNA polymerase primary sigma factor